MMTLRVGSRSGQIFDTSVPEGFDLDVFIHDVRNKGYFWNGCVYIPHDNIGFIVMVPAEVDPMTSQIMTPAGQTRQ